MTRIQHCKYTDSAYPQPLKNLHDSPKQLYWIGPLEEALARPKLAVVGSRKVTPYGRHVTQMLAGAAAEQGITIISGLALGVDGIAHQAALDAHGTTVAVLPTGLAKVYPASHQQLADRIIASGGALLTEYAPEAPPYKVNFVARNRIVAGLADAVLITESALKGGSIHTANFALEQGIPVLAVPGNITSDQSGGTNNLIKAGAIPVTEIRDILSAMGLETITKAIELFGETEAETQLLRLLQTGVSDGSELLYATKLEPHIFNQSLTMLEINGKIRPLGAGHWGLV